MAKYQTQEYYVNKYAVSLRENFGSAQIYVQNARSVLNKATGFISAYDFTLNPIADFGKFARENLYTQRYMGSLARKYLGLNFDPNYGLDDYIILAKR